MEKLLKRLRKKGPCKKTPSSLTPNTSGPLQPQTLLSLPFDLLLIIAEVLSEFRDVLALSASCHALHADKNQLLKVFVQQHYPKFLSAFKEENHILEKLRRLYTLQKIKEANVQDRAISSIAENLCLMKGLGEKIGFKANWKILFTAAVLGDFKTCQYLLKTEKLSLRLGYYTLLKVMETDFLAAKKASHGLFPLRKINNEQIVYDLLFNWDQGKEMLKAASPYWLHDETLNGIVISSGRLFAESFIFNFLGVSVSRHMKTDEKIHAQKALLTGAIAANYLNVVKRLIKDWNIKPGIPEMARIFIQSTRSAPGNPWQELFQSLMQSLSLSQHFSEGILPFFESYRNNLLNYFSELNNMTIQEPGYQALIPELADLLDLPYEETQEKTSQQSLLLTNIKLGRIARVRYLLEKRKLDICFKAEDMELAWITLYKKDSEIAEGMLVYLIHTKAIPEADKMQFIERLLKNDYLKIVLQALASQTKDGQTLAPTEKDKILSLARTLPFEKIIATDRYDILKECLKETPPETIWDIVLKESIRQDSVHLFLLAKHHLSIQTTISMQSMMDLALESISINILNTLITIQAPDHYQSFLVKLLDRILKAYQYPSQKNNHAKILADDWFVLFEKLFTKHIGYFDLNTLDPLCDFIESYDFGMRRIDVTHWIQVLLTLANRISTFQLDDLKINMLQERILKVLKTQCKGILVSKNIWWTLLMHWVKDHYAHFTLNDSQKESLIKEVLKHYLLKQYLFSIDQGYYLPAQEKIIDHVVKLLVKYPFTFHKAGEVIANIIIQSRRYELLEPLVDSNVIQPSDLFSLKKTIDAIPLLLVGESFRSTFENIIKKEDTACRQYNFNSACVQ